MQSFLPIFAVFWLMKRVKMPKKLVLTLLRCQNVVVSVDAVAGCVLNKEEQWKNGFFALSHWVSKRF